jgi:hypothetical protein
MNPQVPNMVISIVIFHLKEGEINFDKNIRILSS